MATHYITSADVGAPSIAGVNGDCVTVFDYCLVTIAGLTKLYSGTNKAVYQMSDTTTVLRIVHDSAVSGGAQYVTARFAESASGIDTLVDPFPLVSMASDTVSRFFVSNTASATTKPWWCLIDTVKHTFIFMVSRQVVGYIDSGMWWAGGSSFLPVDNYASSGQIISSTQGPYPSLFSAAPAPTAGFIKRTRDGTVKSTRIFGCAQFTTNNGDPGATQGPAYPDPDDGKLRRGRAWVADLATQTSSSAGALMEPQRMWLPHVWFGAHGRGLYTGISIGDVVVDSAYNPSAQFAFFPIGTAVGGSGALLLEITDTWSAPTAL